ncbi:MAG: sugar phosphate nucleotidyltransferase [Halobacteriaceae archaeon]
MKAVVLAGGYATRLWPITKNRPKMFLPIGDTLVIDRIFEGLENDDRISEIFVSTNERFADKFENHLKESPYEKPTLSVEETTEEAEKLGVIGALHQLITREGIAEDLIVVAGDNVISFDLSDFIDFFETKQGSALAAYDVGDRERAKSYGLVELADDEVINFQEKPDEPKSTLISIACYGFPAETLSLIGDYLASGENPDEPGWFIQWLQDNHRVHGYTFEEAWFDIGTPASYLDAVAWKLDGANLVAEDAKVENTSLGENVHIMDGATIRDSHIDNSVIFPNATIRNCDVRESIIDKQTHLKNIDFAGAVIGAHTQIADG